jgi:hypothetical protein
MNIFLVKPGIEKIRYWFVLLDFNENIKGYFNQCNANRKTLRNK